MKAADVMVRNVITVGPDASVEDVAKKLLDHRISAVPVVSDNGIMVGIVSEADLLRRSEAGTERQRSRWLHLFTSSETLAAEFARSHARRVSDVMTRWVVTASPDTSLGEIADLLEENGIKRVPIVEQGRILGIVSRADLLRAFVGERKTRNAAADDAAIRSKLVAQLDQQPWMKESLINLIVHRGAVELWGVVDTPTKKKAVRVAAEDTPGVVAVSDNLIVRPLIGAI
jgi:CBS domain-containing protein